MCMFFYHVFFYTILTICSINCSCIYIKSISGPVTSGPQESLRIKLPLVPLLNNFQVSWELVRQNSGSLLLNF